MCLLVTHNVSVMLFFLVGIDKYLQLIVVCIQVILNYNIATEVEQTAANSICSEV